MREFKPEQVKRYLAREVIAGLPNASAIDLSQFAGLFDADAAEDANDIPRAAGRVARRRAGAASAAAYQVSVVGRWSEIDVASAGAAPSAQVQSGATPATPLAGLRCEFDVEDGDGRRRVVLQSVIAGRRYMIGKGEGCDMRVEGTYTSRRHGEIWLENGAWWVGDAGSTNGMRVESPAARSSAAARPREPALGPISWRTARASCCRHMPRARRATTRRSRCARRPARRSARDADRRRRAGAEHAADADPRGTRAARRR